LAGEPAYIAAEEQLPCLAGLELKLNTNAMRVHEAAR
jgi:hypothetical protein